MAKQIINIGTTANDGTGDPLRTAFNKVNLNFTELYDDISSGIISNSSNVRIITSSSSSPKEWRFNANGHVVFPDGSTQTTAFSLADDLIPTQDSRFDLGSSSRQWHSLYVSNTIYIEGIEINASPNGDLSVQGIETSSIKNSSNNTLIIETAETFPIEVHTNSSGIDSTWVFSEVGNLTVPGDIFPEITNTSNFGSPGKVWSSIYVKDLTVTSNTISIGAGSGETSQQDKSIAIGFNAGKTSQEYDAIAIGNSSGEITQSFDAVAVGTSAGNNNQGIAAVSVGYFSGRDSQGNYAVAIGAGAGDTGQHERSIAIGLQAGYDSQDEGAVSIGAGAGETNQGESAVSIGRDSGNLNQGYYSVAIGHWAGETDQGTYSVSTGYYAGANTQGNYSVAIGFESGEVEQGTESVSIGSEAGNDSQGDYSIAIGSEAGKTSQGNYSIALGYYAGQTSQANNTIIINASGSALNSSSDPGFFVKPIRYSSQNNVLQYDSSSGEITYATSQYVIANNVTESLIPDEDSLYDLGSPTNQWKSLYVSANTIFIGGVPISVENGNFFIEGALVDRNNGNFINFDGDLNDNIRLGTASQKQIEIHSDYFGQNYTWTFGSDGGLTVSGNVYGRLNDRLWLGGSDTISTSYISIPAENVANTNPIVIVNPLGGGVNITTNGSTWEFLSNGNINLPGRVVLSSGGIIYGNDNSQNSIIIGENGTNGVTEFNGTGFFNNDVYFNKSIQEKFTTLADATGVVTHDCSNSHIFYHTSPDADWTVNLTNFSLTNNYATEVTIIISRGGTGYYPNALQISGSAQTINWRGNATPTPSSNRVDVVTFSIYRTGAGYTVLGQLTGF